VWVVGGGGGGGGGGSGFLHYSNNFWPIRIDSTRWRYLIIINFLFQVENLQDLNLRRLIRVTSLMITSRKINANKMC